MSDILTDEEIKVYKIAIRDIPTKPLWRDSDMQKALNTIEALQAQLKEEEAKTQFYVKEALEELNQRKALQAQNRKLAEALEFYADDKNFAVTVWEDNDKSAYCWLEGADKNDIQEMLGPHSSQDFGMTAEDALSTLPPEAVTTWKLERNVVEDALVLEAAWNEPVTVVNRTDKAFMVVRSARLLKAHREKGK